MSLRPFITLIALAPFAAAIAQDPPPVMIKSESGVPLEAGLDREMCAPDGVSVGGYDLVSYRQPGGPRMGSPDHSADYAGRTYHFADAENLQEFLGDPERYLPAYSGFCAITLALGRVTCPEYTNFKIEDDRLLLFEVTGFTNGRTLWNSDVTRFRSQADQNHLRLINSF